MSYLSCSVCNKTLSHGNASGRCKRHVRTVGDFPKPKVKRCLDCDAEIYSSAIRCVMHGRIAAKAKLSAALKRHHAERLAWLPDERREEYRKLVKCYREPMAKQMILDDMRKAAR